MIIERHTTSDGLFTLLVDVEKNSENLDYSVGFEGYEWHTHGDLLAAEMATDEVRAIRKFVNQIIKGERVLAILRSGGEIVDVQVIGSTEIGETLKWKAQAEALEFRYWDGERPYVGE